MTTTVLQRVPDVGAVAARRRLTATLLILGGLLMAAGGQLHPTGSGPTVEAHLLSMFGDPRWGEAHVLLLIGSIASVLGFVTAWRGCVFGPRVQRVLPAVMIGWGFGAVEMVPHLWAAHEADALTHHGATPVLDLHVILQVIASPAVGLTGALVAVVVARSARTWPARILAVVAASGGVLSAAAGPLVVLTGDPQYTLLFPFQAGLAVWLVGTGIGLLRRH